MRAGDLNLRKAWIPVEEIINRALERAKSRLETHRMVVAIEREIPAVMTDAVSMTEVLYSVLDNAGKYSPQNSEIKVAAKRAENEMIEFSVEDSGAGIPPDEREHVFDKFYRADHSDIHTTSDGLGLGLAIARGIVESQGGKIWIEDGREKFTTRIVFQIPIGDYETIADGAEESPGENVNAAETYPGR